MLLEQLLVVLGKLCYAVPLLYIGILMMTDPSSLGRLAALVECAQKNFQNELQGLRQARLHEPEPIQLSPAALIAVRMLGFALAVVALLPVIT